MPNARETALKILYKTDFEGAYSNIALKQMPGNLDKRDRAFVTGLVYGVVSRRMTLDYIIGRYSSVKLKKLSDYVLEILRMGIYQMFYMDKVPISAAVNESVKLAKKYAPRSFGFVNGVLRSAQRGGCSIVNEAEICEKYSFPKEICGIFERDYGSEHLESLLEALNTAPDMTVRINSLKTNIGEMTELFDKKGITAEKVPGFDFALKVSGLDVGEDTLYGDGYYTVQGLAEMLAVEILAPLPGDTVYDMCAAPGGKTAYIGELMKNKGMIYAFDIHQHKTELIKRNMTRLGISNVFVDISDSTAPKDEFMGTADRVLCDVPCSGLGIISKKPDIKWNFRPSELTYIQSEILKNGASYLKSGARLVYSTCTLNKEENENIINKFLEENKGYRLCDIADYIPARFVKPNEKMLTLYPDTDKTDGFFIAVIEKE